MRAMLRAGNLVRETPPCSVFPRGGDAWAPAVKASVSRSFRLVTEVTDTTLGIDAHVCVRFNPRVLLPLVAPAAVP